MIFLSKEESISEIYSTKDSIYFAKEDVLLDINLKSITNLFKSTYIVDGILYSNTPKELYFFDFQNQKFDSILKLSEETSFFEVININNVIACIEEEDEKLVMYNNRKQKWKIPYAPAYYNLLSENVFLLRNNYKTSQITNIDLEIVKPLWQYTLPEGFSIFKQPQIVGDVLFFDSFKNGNEENFVVGLDIKTGEVLWQLLFKIPYKEQLLATTLHKENKLCYGYLGNLYQIFNPISGKIVFEKEMNENINPYTNAIYDNKLWFVSGKYEECKFGYINLANNELEFIQDFPQEDDETFEIVYHQKKLYLRGKYYNNLYIFEE
nr:MAG TPA: PQQ-like domain [Bacteriophage sp.]